MANIFKLAVDSLRRQRERTAFTVVGLALAIATVVLVYGISLRFEGSSSDSLSYITGAGNLWLLPPAGFNASNPSQFLMANGTLAPEAIAALRAQPGVTRITPAISAPFRLGATTLAIYGTGSQPPESVVLGRGAAAALHAATGGTVSLHSHQFHVTAISDSVPLTVIQMSYSDASETTGQANPSWIIASIQDARQFADTATAFSVTADPAVSSADPGKLGLAYALEGQLSRFSVFSFKTKFGAAILSHATSTIFGEVARVTLLLGFLLAISSALMSIEERRVEFGILAAVGITDDVLYLFLAESAIVFVVGFALGSLLGAAAYWALLPELFTVDSLLKAMMIVSTFVPAMLILGALIPLNRLLQQTPLELMRAAA